MVRLRMISACALLSIAALSLSGCAAVVAVAGLKAGTTVVQERPVGQAIDDLTMKTELVARLAGQNPTYQSVTTRVVNGVVLMTGSVQDQTAKDEAARIAWDIQGVRNVGNELDVQSGVSVGDYLNDVRISDQLRTKVLTDRSIAWVNYNVTTTNGNVYLMGIAKDQEELDRVTLHARTIPGVKKVVSYVEVRQPSPMRQQQALNQSY